MKEKYRGYIISYEQEHFFGRKGTRKGNETIESPTLPELKSDIDKVILSNQRSKEFEILLYKGYHIFTDGLIFYAKKTKKDTAHLFESGKESLVKAAINDAIEHIKIEKANEQKKIETEKQSKIILKRPMKLKVDSVAFKKLICAAYDYINYARLTIESGQHKITFVEMDPANVVMIKGVIPFEGKAHAFKGNINIGNLANIVKTIVPKENYDKDLNLTIQPGEAVKLILSNNCGEFEIPFDMEDDGRVIKVPNLKYNLEIQMQKVELKSYLSLARLVAEAVAFDIKDGAFKMYAEGDMNKFTKENIAPLKTPIIGDFKAKYSLEYLMKSIVPGNHITIQFSKDYPLKITDSLGNIFILAPRVENG